MDRPNNLEKRHNQNKRKISKNKRNAFISGLYTIVAYKALSFLESGKANEAIIFVIGAFFVCIILNQLAKLVDDE
ncbi:MAG: hypothetical protein M3033_01190 [Acidobacteriota bacterium]|nr:hypothetical protein [Acidobacteriota bacterium]